MEGKCLPRPPNSAAKEGLLIPALTLPPSASPDPHPPPTDQQSQVRPSSDHPACSSFLPHVYHAELQGPCVHSRELGPVDVVATGVIVNDV